MASPTPDAVARAIGAHRLVFGEPLFVARAPGRVNLIGEHTDYNDGFVLPMALPFATAIAVSRPPAGSAVVGNTIAEVRSEGFGTAHLGLGDAPLSSDDWAIHLRGVHKLLGEAGVEAGPWRGTIATDVPTGASLSSSAALEVAVILAMLKLAGLEWPGVEIAQLAQRVENEVVGLGSGIMDQLISATAVEGSASLIDCRTLAIEECPLPEDATVVVMDTATRRTLVASAFDDRRAECAAAASELGLSSLRDATVTDLARLAEGSVIARRSLHVVSENTRTLAAAEAMHSGDAAALGQLMNQSHASLRDDYEVSGPALNHIVEIAGAAPGCLGARMTGGGFAGCAVALVETADLDAFRDVVSHHYGDSGDHGDGRATLWACAPGQGASIIGRDDLG